MNPAEQIDKLSRLAIQIRQSIIAALPTARDQFLTISMPGRIIDTTPGGEFVPAEKYSASADNKRKVNEAKLVDSMIPLSNVMLGPTGKSVTRSYLSALDHLVPANAGLDLEHLESDESTAATTKYQAGSKYNAAMKYLRSPAPVTTAGRTIVDIYIDKQTEYARAQAYLEGILIKNAGAAHENKAGMTAEELAIATSEMKRANDKVQAAWMDWVINGHKTMIDHHFAIVDTTTIMSRIEMAKAALRRATISDIEDSTEWARVTLSPENWAVLCEKKAKSWASRNPLSPAVIQLEITRLKKVIVALKGNLAWATAHATTNPPADEVHTNSNPPKPPTPELVRLKTAWTDAKKALKDAEDTNEDESELAQLRTAVETTHQSYLTEKHKENPDTESPESQNEIDSYKDVVEAAKDFHSADDAAAQASKKAVVLAKSAIAGKLLEENMAKETALVGQMVASNAGELKKSLELKIEELQDEISDLEKGLANGTKSSEARMKVITGVEKFKNGADDEYVPVESDPEVSDYIKNALDPTVEEANPWTTISFTASAISSAESSSSSSLSVHAELEVGWGMFSGSASSDVSKASSQLKKKMEESSVTGTFDAILVQINRPWLHSELFEDTDIDMPATSKMSPGSKDLKDWIDNKRESELTAYGTFPWYPTAFIVAADTELEIKCSRSDAEILASSMSTDSSFSASYGPWASGSGRVKTDDKSSSHRMEITATGMKVCFKAPQIIGWVSEILPELPRRENVGGLRSVPVRYAE